jgi:hypothetical protein
MTDTTKEGKTLYMGVANLQAVGACIWVISCGDAAAAIQPPLRRRQGASSLPLPPQLPSPPLTGRRLDVDRAKGRGVGPAHRRYRGLVYGDRVHERDILGSSLILSFYTLQYKIVCCVTLFG